MLELREGPRWGKSLSPDDKETAGTRELETGRREDRLVRGECVRVERSV